MILYSYQFEPLKFKAGWVQNTPIFKIRDNQLLICRALEWRIKA